MDLGSISTPASAFVAGLITSAHCAIMCGPIACWLAPAKGPEDATLVAATYHTSRLFGYATVGVIAGGLGGLPGGVWVERAALLVPWAMVVLFLSIALGLKGRPWLPRVSFKWYGRLNRWTSGKSPFVVAAGTGLLTPFLPCGPLYAMVGIAMLSGTAHRGAEFMIAFGAGTLPLLWLAQARLRWFQQRCQPRTLQLWQRGIAVAALCVMVWRLRGTFGGLSPRIGDWVCF